MSPDLVTAPDERRRCCVVLPDGSRCAAPSRFWVGTNGVDDYTYACAAHLADVRRPGDVVAEAQGSKGGGPGR